SAPEILVSIVAALQGNPGLAVGNALGSNITNVALILGLTAVIAPLQVNSQILRREFPILLTIMLVALLLLWDNHLGLMDGVILVGGMFVLAAGVVWLGLRSQQTEPMIGEFDAEIPRDLSTGKALLWTLLGLVVLMVSSRMLVWGSVEIAHALGVSDLVIGLTIVAIGTSLPELAASVMSALKGEHDIAIGNVIGSNMFNLLAVLGLPGLIHPAAIEPAVVTRDFPVMIGLTLVLLVLAYGVGGRGHIKRFEGAFLLACYGGYLALLYFTTLATA
ncbi:MAG TPA: calcium/sodium antiporter, partial [Gammaproteobacteria bacterium]